MKMSKSSRSMQGRRAKARGDRSQQMLESTANLIEDIALIPQHPAVKILGDIRKPGNVIIDKHAYPDYILLQTPPKSPFMFDLKTTLNAATVTLPQKTMHQWDTLYGVASMGIPAFYLVLWTNQDVATVHPVALVSRFDRKLNTGNTVISANTQDIKWLRFIISEISRQTMSDMMQGWWFPKTT